ISGQFTVERLGDMILPTEILVQFADGKQELIPWNGEADKAKTYTFDKAISTVKVDPQNKLLLDLNFNNNSKAVDPSMLVFRKYTMKIMFWIQNMMQWMAGLA
ncbi:MAG TPA: M1 family peptidase, partial [Emticicia sp.]